MEKITINTLVTKSELSCVLGLTSKWISQLTEDGILQSNGGKYLLADSVQKYVAYKTKNLANATDAEIERAKKKAEAQLKAAKAVVAELEADELKGKMHRSEDVADLTEDLIYTIRAGLLALPGRLAVDTAAASSASETADIIRREVFTLMKSLADYEYDPAKYEERVRERMDWEVRTEDADD